MGDVEKMNKSKIYPVFLGAVALVFSLLNGVKAQQGEGNVEPFKIYEGETKVVDTDYRISDIAVGDPEVADVQIKSATEFIVNGIKNGVTSIQVWDTNDAQRDSFSVEVKKPLTPTSLIEVQCQVIEVKTSSLLDVGVDWVDQIKFQESSIPGIVKLGTIERADKVFATLNAKVEDGYGRILAKPKLLARSGGSAKFRIGGEIPYLVSGGQGQTTVEWKKYGIVLNIKPDGDKRRGMIDVDLGIEVSTLDYENAVQQGGNSIPAIAMRKTDTSVQVNSGQTIVLSGLKKVDEQESSTGVPVLSKIPVLGQLFKFATQTESETEVTVFMTPKFSKGEK